MVRNRTALWSVEEAVIRLRRWAMQPDRSSELLRNARKRRSGLDPCYDPAMDVQDRVVAITGGSQGIGLHLAREFLNSGLKVGVCSRSEPPEDILAHDRAYWRRADVTRAVDHRDFLERTENALGPVDVWVNNAGVLAPIGMGRSIDATAFGALIDVNVKGVFNGCRAYLGALHRNQRRGCIINISSGAATAPYAGWGAYCASKAAVDMFSKVLAEEERGFGNRVYSLAPGVIATAMQDLIRQQAPEDFPAVEKFRDLARSDRFVSPAVPARAILHLAFSEEPHGETCVDARVLAAD